MVLRANWYSSLMNLGGGSIITPITIWGSLVRGWFLMGNAGLAVSDNSFRTLDTSSGENNVSVWKNQVVGQPNLEQSIKFNMPQILANDIAGQDSVNVDIGNIGMFSPNTVSGTGNFNLVMAVIRPTGNLGANNRIAGVSTDAGFDWNATNGFGAILSASTTILSQFYNSNQRANDSGAYVDTWLTSASTIDTAGSTIRRNGTQTGTSSFTGSLTFNRFLLGMGSATSFQNCFFRCPELIYVSSASAIPTAQIQAAENYLRSKYGHY